MKNSIAVKLTVRVAILLLLAFVILFVGSYLSVSKLVRDERDHYAKAIVGIYADFVVYEAEGVHLPIDLSYASQASFYGDYICSWYRVDYAYMYIPDVENDTIQYISVSRKKEIFGESPKGYMSGTVKQYKLSKDELAAWNGEQIYAVVKNNTFEPAVDTVMMAKDSFGNKVMIGAAVSTADIEKEVQNRFFAVAMIILAVFACLIPFMYILIRKKVSVPAQRICRSMTEFITDGKRSDVKLNESGNDEFAMIADSFNSMTGDIDNYLEDIRTLSREQERQKTEIEVAANIQKGFLPPERMISGDYEICATMKPAKDIGGDLYDYFQLDDTHTMLFIADVSGKGIAAAMFMSVILVLARQFAKLGQGPAMILQNVNDMLFDRNPNMLFATAFIGIYDSSTNTLTYSNAGHNPPYILNDTTAALDGAQNILLGLFHDEEYTEESVKMEIGDVLFLYTDGVNEAVDADNNFYGTQRLEQTIISARKLHSDNLVKSLSDSVSEFTGDHEQHDDITMLTFTVKKSCHLSLSVDEHEFSKIKDTILASDLPRPLQIELCVAAEECFINICSYAFEGRNTDGERIFFDFEHSDRIAMRFTDNGIPYDPRESVIDADDYDMDVQIGGLGKLIAFTVADVVDYEYTDKKNILTITKYIREDFI